MIGFKPGEMSDLKPFFVCYQTPPILFFSTFAARQLKANGYLIIIRKLSEKTTILTKDKHEVF